MGATLALQLAAVANAQCTYNTMTSIIPTPADSAWGVGSALSMKGSALAIGAASRPKGGDANVGYAWVYRDASGWAEEEEFEHPSGDLNDYFGFSIAIDGDVMAVGAPVADTAGQVVVFRKVSGTWDAGTVIQSGETHQERFGHSVALEGDTLVVGAPWYDVSSLPEGRVYIFRYDSGTGDWVNDQQIGRPSTDQDFGWSVALKGDVLVVGAPFNASGFPGSAHVFTQVDNMGDLSFVHEQEITDGDANDRYGYSVAIDETAGILVGAPGDDEVDGNAGAVYVWERVLGTWQVQSKILPCDGGDMEVERFGQSVAVSGRQLCVGARDSTYTPSSPDAVGTGSSFVLDRGCAWNIVDILRDVTPESGEEAGTSVAASASYVAIGVPGDDADTNPDKNNVGSFAIQPYSASALCLGDLDCDGDIDGADMATLLGAYGDCYGCFADLDASTDVDSADLAILLGGWGSCPSYMTSMTSGEGESDSTLLDALEELGFESQEAFEAWLLFASDEEVRALVAD